MGKRKNFTPEQIDLIRRMTMEGYPQEDIANKLETTKTTIRRYQYKLGLKASTKWSAELGETAEKAPIDLSKESRTSTAAKKQEQQKYITMTNRLIRFTGNRTNFSYEYGMDATTLRITTGYCDPFDIDLKDLVSFGCELLDTAEAINQM